MTAVLDQELAEGHLLQAFAITSRPLCEAAK